MDSSSDSSFVDEELCIRPPDGSSIETIKSWLLKDVPHGKTSRRNTFSGMDTLSGDFMAGECSEYFTPDSTMSKPSACFLEKMKAALDEPSSSHTSYQTACNETANTTMSRRSSLPRLDICDLETLTLSHQFRDNIVISDDEIDDDFLRYQGTQIKYENISAVEIDDDNEETDNSFTNGEHDEQDNKIVYETPAQEESDCLSYEYSLNSSKSYEDSLKVTDCKNYLYVSNTNKDVVQEVDDCYSADCSAYSSSVAQSSSDYSGFNRAEHYFLTPPKDADKGALSRNRDEKLDPKRFFRTPTNPVRKSGALKSRRADENMEPSHYLPSPQVKYKNISAVELDDHEELDYCSEKKEFFKVPSALPRRQYFVTPPCSAGKEALKPKNRDEKREPKRYFLTPTKPARKSADKFKHIQSPVGFYIKNSTTSAINRHVKALKQPIVLPDDFFDDVPDLSHRWEFAISEVIYRPGAKKYETPIKDIDLPKNIQELVPRVTNMYVAKHEARSKRAVDQEDIRRKLHEDLDLTRKGALSAPQDISIIHVKNPFSKR